MSLLRILHRFQDISTNFRKI